MSYILCCTVYSVTCDSESHCHQSGLNHHPGRAPGEEGGAVSVAEDCAFYLSHCSRVDYKW